jgi:hypothetical protein
MAPKLTRDQNALLRRAIAHVASMDPNEILREHLEAIAAGEEVSALTSAEDARDILAQHPRDRATVGNARPS